MGQLFCLVQALCYCDVYSGKGLFLALDVSISLIQFSSLVQWAAVLPAASLLTECACALTETAAQS